MEARWLDSMTARVENRAVVVHNVAYAPVPREFDAVTLVNLLCEAVHGREFGVFVLGERPTNVQDHCRSCEIHPVAVPSGFGVFVLGERQTNVQDDCYSYKILMLRARRLGMEKE